MNGRNIVRERERERERGRGGVRKMTKELALFRCYQRGPKVKARGTLLTRQF